MTFIERLNVFNLWFPSVLVFSSKFEVLQILAGLPKCPDSEKKQRGGIDFLLFCGSAFALYLTLKIEEPESMNAVQTSFINFKANFTH